MNVTAKTYVPACTAASLRPCPVARPFQAAVPIRMAQLPSLSNALFGEPVRTHTSRLCAKKGGDKGGDKGAEKESKKGGDKGGATATEDVAKVAKETEQDAENRMKKALTALGENFNTVRTGRANAAILDKITVEYFGSATPLKNIATFSTPDSSTLVVSPFDKGALKDIERAIQEADIGINPNNDGSVIRLVVPQLTGERRKELSKTVAKMGEDAKVAIRNVRKDVMKKVEKVDFGKDAKKDLEDKIQKITDAYVKKVEDAVKAKTDDIMKV